jgi:hypothetical protein
VLLVLIHLRTNLTTRALAALFGASQYAVDRSVPHLVPLLARRLRPDADGPDEPWIIDGTLIPVHDQTITAVSKNYRRSVNTQVPISAHSRSVVTVGRCWPGNRNDVVVARATVAHLLSRNHHGIPGDGGYRGINTITTPPDATTPAGSSAMTTTGRTAGSGPASNTSSPASKTGKYCGNADVVAMPSTTASKSSPASGTSKPTRHDGSTLSVRFAPAQARGRVLLGCP